MDWLRPGLAFVQRVHQVSPPGATPPAHQEGGQVCRQAGMPKTGRTRVFFGPTEKQADAESQQATGQQ